MSARLPAPQRAQSWNSWGEALVRALQFIIDNLSGRIAKLETNPVIVSSGSGSYTMDDGTATTTGGFTLEEGGA